MSSSLTVGDLKTKIQSQEYVEVFLVNIKAFGKAWKNMDEAPKLLDFFFKLHNMFFIIFFIVICFDEDN